jgi:hypothetical protein
MKGALEQEEAFSSHWFAPLRQAYTAVAVVLLLTEIHHALMICWALSETEVSGCMFGDGPLGATVV